MMDEKRYSDLQVLYTLLNRVSEGAYRMCFFLYTYIKVLVGNCFSPVDIFLLSTFQLLAFYHIATVF